VENDKGAKCLSQDAGSCDSAKERCDGDHLTLCVLGQATSVDCRALGLGACRTGEGGRPYCSKK
jgi:hypothetical protein